MGHFYFNSAFVLRNPNSNSRLTQASPVKEQQVSGNLMTHSRLRMSLGPRIYFLQTSGRVQTTHDRRGSSQSCCNMAGVRLHFSAK